MNNYLATQTGQQNASTFTYGDGPRVGRPITGGRSWFAQWTAQKDNSTPVALNDPPENLPDYNPRERLSIMQQRDASGALADPWSSVDHGALAGLFGHLPFRRRLPIEQPSSPSTDAPTSSSTGTWRNGVRPLPVASPSQPATGASDNGGASDPTVALQQQLLAQMTGAQPLGGIGATVPVEQQTIGGGGGGNALPVLALLAVAIGAIAFLYLHKRKKPEAEGNAVASA